MEFGFGRISQELARYHRLSQVITGRIGVDPMSPAMIVNILTPESCTHVKPATRQQQKASMLQT